MNAERIKSTACNFLQYRNGFTPFVAKAIHTVKKVRIKIGEAFGFQLDGVIEVSNQCYNQYFTNLVDLAQNSMPHNRLKAPSDVEN